MDNDIINGIYVVTTIYGFQFRFIISILYIVISIIYVAKYDLLDISCQSLYSGPSGTVKHSEHFFQAILCDLKRLLLL